MTEFVYKVLLALCVAFLLVLAVIAAVDTSKNGMSDCTDDPKYCRSPHEKAQYWEDWQ